MKHSHRIYFLFAAMSVVFLFNRCGYPSYSSFQPDSSNSRDWNVEVRRSALPSHDVTIRINDEEVLVASFFNYPKFFRNVYKGKTVEAVTSYQQDSATYIVEVTINGLLVKRLEFAD